MRRLHLADLDAAAHALATQPVHDRAGCAAEVMVRARAADKYRKRHGRAHPQWGCGTVADAASGFAKPTRLTGTERDYWSAMAQLLLAYLDARGGVSPD